MAVAPALTQHRAEAWATLLTQPDALPSRSRRDALLLARQNAGTAQRARVARSACRGARDSISRLQRSFEARPAAGIAREWVLCLEELLAAAERICELAAER
jgi:hypothetical protein